jgi:hypothetical protein
VFTSDGAVPIDNNVSEREMKRVVLNRKNSLFVGNLRGGRTAAILASLTSSSRRHEMDPQLYFMQLLMNLPSWPVNDIDAWLPDRWKKAHRGWSIPKMPSGANAFEISDIQEERNREPVLAKQPEFSNVMLHCVDNLPWYQFARDRLDFSILPPFAASTDC